jgi:hypothetical protein
MAEADRTSASWGQSGNLMLELRLAGIGSEATSRFNFRAHSERPFIAGTISFTMLRWDGKCRVIRSFNHAAIGAVGKRTHLKRPVFSVFRNMSPSASRTARAVFDAIRCACM